MSGRLFICEKQMAGASRVEPRKIVPCTTKVVYGVFLCTGKKYPIGFIGDIKEFVNRNGGYYENYIKRWFCKRI